MCGKVVYPSSFTDHQVDEKDPEEENKTIIRDYKADEAPEGDVQYKGNLPQNVTVQKRLLMVTETLLLVERRIHIRLL